MRTRRAKVVLAGLCVYIFIVYGLIVYSYGLLMPQISADLQIPMAQMSMTYTVRLLCGSLATQLGSRLMKRIDSRVYFLVVSVALAGVLLLSSCASRFWQFLALAVCGGLFLGVSTYIMIPLLCSEWFEEPAAALGIATAASGLGGVVCSPLLSSIIEAEGWRSCFRAASLGTGAVLIPVSLFMLQYSPAQSGAQRVPARGRKKEEASDDREAELHPGSSKGQAVFFLCMCIFICSSLSLVPALYPSMMLEKGVAQGGAGLLLSCMQLGNVAAPLLIGFSMHRLGLQRAMTAFLAAAAVGCLGTAFLPGARFGLLGVSGVLLAFARIEGVVMPVMVRRLYGSAEYGSIYPKLYLAFYLATALVVSCYGWLHDLTGSYTVVYAVMLGGLVLSVALARVVFIIAARNGKQDKQ